ncbi:MAG TPA: asparaginase [Candidatus Nanopelagicaceae bacterium]
MSLPKVTLFTLGGTIASTSTSAKSGGVVPQLNAQEILASVPQLEVIAQIEPVAFRQVPSGDLNFSDLFALASAIEVAFSDGSVGVVITQGTDSIEESAFVLDLLTPGGRPIVVTGAMRNPTQVSSDGPANLLSAVQVAISEAAVGLGVLVVLNEEVHTARFVRKTHTSTLGTFQSPTIGPIGWISEGRVHIPYRISKMKTIEHGPSTVVPPVAVVTCALGDDALILGEIESLGYKGVVIEGFGGGHVPARVVPAIEDLASRIPVILTSRTGAGELLRQTYAFPGSEQDVLSRGAVSAGSLDGIKARILLSLILTLAPELDEAKRAFEDFVQSIL